MAIEKLTQDLAVITKLSDYPGSQDGLSTAEFKAKFDEAALTIQAYINEVLIPEIEAGAGSDAFLRLVGGIMQGAIDMNGNGLVNLPNPTNDGDACPKSYAVAKSGDVMTGALYVPDPTDSGHAANKGYVDAVANRAQYYTVTLLAASWAAQNGGGYSQAVSLSGITAEDRPCYGAVYSGTNAEKLTQAEAWALVSDLDTSADTLTFTAFSDAPAVDLTVQIEVRRSGGGEENTSVCGEAVCGEAICGGT